MARRSSQGKGTPRKGASTGGRPRKAAPKPARKQGSRGGSRGNPKGPRQKKSPRNTSQGRGRGRASITQELTHSRPVLFGRWLIIRGVIVYLAFNLGLNLFLNLTQPLKPLRLFTVNRVDERLDAAAYLFRHYLPMHGCSEDMNPTDARALAREVARDVGVEPALLVALVEVESSLRPHAISPVGAMGFGQLMPSTAAWLKVADPFHPRENLEGAARYIKSLKGRFGDVKLALAAYNAGPGAVSRHGGIPPYGETQRYVRRVVERMAYHQAQASSK